MDLVFRAIFVLFLILLVTRVVLRRERLTREELAAEARLAHIGSLSDVHYAVLETSGRISFLTTHR